MQVILRAMKKYGMIVADNGSNWYISGAPDPRWNDDELHAENDQRFKLRSRADGNDRDAGEANATPVAAYFLAPGWRDRRDSPLLRPTPVL